MRPLELLTAALLALVYSRPLAPASLRRRWSRHLPPAALGAVLLHLTVEGYRWQMLPLYALSLATIPGWLVQARTPGANLFTPRRTDGSLLGLALTLIFALLPVLLPVPNPPAPGGPYAVGTLTVVLSDPQRQEIYSAASGEPRRILLQLWYPAQAQPGVRPAAWIEEAQMPPAIARYLGLPGFFLDHARLVQTHSLPQAPLAPAGGPFPVVLFSHGWSGFRGQNTHQMEELASQGYVLAALQHPYGALLTIFPDGSQAPKNPDALPTGAPLDVLDPAADRLADQWAGDMALALDSLAAWNQNDPSGRFTGRLELERVAVMGHSTGGGAAIEFCARDRRCKAGIGLDAYLTPVSTAVLQQGLSQPFLYMYSEAWPSTRNRELFSQLQLASRGPVYSLSMRGTDHYDFTDLPLLTPLAASIGLKGPLPGRRVIAIIDDYQRAFLQQHLLGIPAELLQPDNAGRFPEVELQFQASQGAP